MEVYLTLCFLNSLFFRGNKRPIDHRNLISLTGGPDNYINPQESKSVGTESSKAKPTNQDDLMPAWLQQVLKSHEALPRDRKPTDLNEQVINLLDSFDPDQKDLSGFLSSIRASGDIRQMKAADEPLSTIRGAYTSSDSRTKIANVAPSSLVPIHKVEARPSERLAYPPSHGSVEQKFQSPSHHSKAPSSSSRSFSSSRFSRPPYHNGPR